MSHVSHSSLKNLITSLSQYKTFGILGFGKEGKSFLSFLLRMQLREEIHINKIFIFDKYLSQDILDEYLLQCQKNTNAQKRENIEIIVYSGEGYLKNLGESDITVKSPGVSCFHENITDDDIHRFNITSLSDLFLQFFGSQTIGITGTKGKSTTASLLHHLFLSAGKNTFLVGNIGVPVFDTLENITEDAIVIHEFSSHQLEKITVGPYIAVLLNLFPEHLDYYKNAEHYFNAKKRIFTIGDNTKGIFDNYISIENKKFLENTALECSNKRKNKYYFGEDSKSYYESMQNISLHKDTIRVVKIICDIYELWKNENEFVQCVNSFPSLPHRLEVLTPVSPRKNKTILYVNDSISTIPSSTISGMRAMEKLEKIYNASFETILLGGFDRGVCLDELIDFIVESSVKNILLTGETGKILEKKLQSLQSEEKKAKTIIYKKDLKDLLMHVASLSSHKSICLFSPSASSFDQYKNFEERGNYFKQLVKSLEKK